MSETINILVTAIGGGGHGEQILKALLLANNRRYRLYGADMNPSCPQFSYVENHVVLPRADHPGFIDKVLETCELFDIKVLFHGCEPELRRYSDERRRFEERGVMVPINPKHVIDICMNKEETFRILQANGIDVPRYMRISERADLGAVDFFPAVVKPSVGGGGSADVFIVQSANELEALAAYLDLDGHSTQFVIQEYVGSPEQEFTVGVLHDMDGQYLNAIALRRHLSGQLNIRSRVINRTGRVELGPLLVISSGISHGDLGRYPEVTEPCIAIARALGSTSAINVQCRLVKGRVKVFEINPRFSGTTSLRAMVGFNEPDVLIRKHLLGEKITPSFAYEEATILRSLEETRM